MMSIVADKPFYRLKQNSFMYRRLRAEKFEDLFELVKKEDYGSTIFFSSKKELLNILNSSKVTEVDLTKSFYVDRDMLRYYKHFLIKAKVEKNIKFVEKPEEADYIILNRPLESYIDQPTYSLSIIEDSQNYYDIENNFASTNKTLNILKESNFLPEDAHIKTIAAGDWCYTECYHKNEIFPLIGEAKYCSPSDFLKNLTSDYIPLEPDNIEMLLELLNSGDKDSRKLGFKLLATSNYSELPMTIGYLGAKFARSYGSLGLEGDEIEILNEMFKNAPWKEVDNNSVTSLNYIVSSVKNPTENDAACIKEIFDMDTITDRIEHSISKKTIETLNTLGYTVNVTVTKK